MRLTGSEKLETLCRKHADARPAIERWVEIMRTAQWQNHAEMKNDFLSADFVGNDRYVFNIKGTNTDWWLLLSLLLDGQISGLQELIKNMIK